MSETPSIHQRAATSVGRSGGSAHSYREPLERAAGILPAGRALGPADKMSAARWFMAARRGSRIVEAARDVIRGMGTMEKSIASGEGDGREEIGAAQQHRPTTAASALPPLPCPARLRRAPHLQLLTSLEMGSTIRTKHN